MGARGLSSLTKYGIFVSTHIIEIYAIYIKVESSITLVIYLEYVRQCYNFNMCVWCARAHVQASLVERE